MRKLTKAEANLIREGVACLPWTGGISHVADVLASWDRRFYPRGGRSLPTGEDVAELLKELGRAQEKELADR